MRNGLWFEFVCAIVWLGFAVYAIVNPDGNYRTLFIIAAFTLTAICAILGFIGIKFNKEEHDS